MSPISPRATKNTNFTNLPPQDTPNLALEIKARDVRAMSFPDVLRYVCGLQEDGATYDVAAVQAAQNRIRNEKLEKVCPEILVADYRLNVRQLAILANTRGAVVDMKALEKEREVVVRRALRGAA